MVKWQVVEMADSQFIGNQMNLHHAICLIIGNSSSQNPYPKLCSVAVTNSLVMVSCNESAMSTIPGVMSPAYTTLIGYSVLIQNSLQCQYLKTVQVFGSVTTVTVNFDKSGQYRVTIFPIRSNVFESISEPVIHSEVVNISYEDESNDGGIKVKGMLKYGQGCL